MIVINWEYIICIYFFYEKKNVIFIFVNILVDLNEIMSVNVNLKYETKNIEKNKHK